MAEVIIVYTSDTHGLLNEKLFAEAIARAKATAGADMLLDGGDAITPPNLSWKPSQELATMKQLDYDAVAVGNHEFHELPFCMRRKVGSTAPPLLATNLRLRRWWLLGTRKWALRRYTPGERPAGSDSMDAYGLWPVSASRIIVTKAGVRVGVIGVAPSRPYLTWRSLWNPLQWFARAFDWLFYLGVLPFRWCRFESVVRAVNEEAARLAGEGADLVVVMSHSSPGQNSRLIRHVRGVNVILGAHEHAKYPLPTPSDKVPFIQYFDRRSEHWRRQNATACILKLRVEEVVKLTEVQVVKLPDLSVIESAVYKESPAELRIT